MKGNSLKYGFLCLLALFIVSCGHERLLQLPEISHSEITELSDISAAYLFYDELEKDSVELNRKNLISTTNWLVNVDKRLTLKQVIPHIKYLQEKKQNAGHKNPNARNYFTCHDTFRNTLGFIDFTDIIYKEQPDSNDPDGQDSEKSSYIIIHYVSQDRILIRLLNDDPNALRSSHAALIKDLGSISSKLNKECVFILNLNENLTFQKYIEIKSLFNSNEFKNGSLSPVEYISN
ncbi:hypothetical protein [Aestuariivivens sediminicola]|uniref:hypothetical protein n=1 Tax=Aestuariivivens sediminicola TaxID=2913560 RepID=UPI001F571750|nr:hypothetical protein [Aestuariivivens sediminicola]